MVAIIAWASWAGGSKSCGSNKLVWSWLLGNCGSSSCRSNDNDSYMVVCGGSKQQKLLQWLQYDTST